MDKRRAVLVASRFRDGGVERWMNRLAAGLLAQGVACDFVLGELQPGGAVGLIPEGVTVHCARHRQGVGAVLQRLLGNVNGKVVVLPFRTADYSSVVRAVSRYPSAATLYLITGAFVSQRTDPGQAGWFRAWKSRRRLLREWVLADGVIAVSTGVARDWRQAGFSPAKRVYAPPPPIIGPEVAAQSRLPLSQGWGAETGVPLFVGVGRLTENKAFDYLLQAFAALRCRHPARLAIVGKGPAEHALKNLARSLGIQADVLFPGFVSNPYPWMRQARALVLTSKVEPFGFVLIEALAVGTPFVAMDGPAGPRQVQQDTQQGFLVPQGDVNALSRMMAHVLKTAPAASELHAAAAPYALDNSIQHYMDIVFPHAIHQNTREFR